MIRNIKKGQTEVMGLVIIVILVTIGIIFTLTQVFKSDEIEIKESFQKSQLSANLLNSISSTHTTCDYTMKSLMQDCVTKLRIKCIINQTELDSCQYINYAFNKILNSTLDKWDYDYIFLVTHGDKRLYEKTFQCDEYETSFHYIPTTAGNIELRLSICR